MKTFVKSEDCGVLTAYYKRIAPSLAAFFEGRLYPVWLILSVLVGRLTNLEVYFSIADLMGIAVALVVCDTLRPMIPITMSFLYRIPLDHAPGIPTYSDYYSGINVVIPFLLLGAVILAMVYQLVRRRVFTAENLKGLPMLVSLSLLSVSFLLAGTFNPEKSASDYFYALFQILAFAVILWLFYLGLKGERAGELCSYFTYVCATVALILIFEVGFLYAFEDVGLSSGAIDKSRIFFGWGISNTCAGALTVLIPICFLGAIKSKYRAAYVAIATLALVATVFTLSRNGLLFGTVFYVISFIISCFVGEGKRENRYYALAAAGITACLFILLPQTISELFESMISQGFDDNGRYRLWRMAIDGFTDRPVFGNGFYSFAPDVMTYASFIPYLAHNTMFEIMNSMGAVGLTSYFIYRANTALPFFENVRIEKIMLFLSVAVLLIESLVDNFILWFAPTFVYNIAIIIAIKYTEEDTTSETE